MPIDDSTCPATLTGVTALNCGNIVLFFTIFYFKYNCMFERERDVEDTTGHNQLTLFRMWVQGSRRQYTNKQK